MTISVACTIDQRKCYLLKFYLARTCLDQNIQVTIIDTIKTGRCQSNTVIEYLPLIDGLPFDKQQLKL